MIKLKYPLKFVGITQDFKPTHLATDLAWNVKYGKLMTLCIIRSSAYKSTMLDMYKW